jgi:hypothetical protein
VVFPNQDKHAVVGIKLLSGTAPEEVIYTHVGWLKVDGEWVYLHGDGGIGADGVRANIKTALPEGLVGRMRLSLAKDNENRIAAIRSSLDLLKVGPERIMLPLLAAVYRVPIDSCDFAIDLIGESGVFKSAIAALAQQHFGAEFADTQGPKFRANGRVRPMR